MPPTRGYKAASQSWFFATFPRLSSRTSHFLPYLAYPAMFFSLKHLAVVASLAATAAAQSIAIGYPLDGSSVTKGKNFTVEVDRPVRLCSFLPFCFLAHSMR